MRLTAPRHSSDVSVPEVRAQTAKLSCDFHFASVHCKHRASFERCSFSRQHSAYATGGSAICQNGCHAEVSPCCYNDSAKCSVSSCAMSASCLG